MLLFESPFYRWTLRNILLPIGDWASDQRMLARLEFLRQAQWWPAGQVDLWRSQQLTRLAQVASEQVPFYNQLFRSASIRWQDIRHVEDLAQLPVVTKALLRAGFPSQVTRDSGFPCHTESSSGSTGQPFLIREDSETAGFRRAAFLLSLEWAGWRLGEAHVQTGATLERDWERRLKDIFFRCHYFPAMHLDPVNLDRALDTIDRKRIRHLWGYPCALNALAVRARNAGWNGAPLSTIVTWADQLYPEYRANIEGAFRTPVFDTYGCAEGIQISAQCGHGSHYHVHAMDTMVEYLDSHDRAVKPGEVGRVVVTRLLPGAMPFLRYDTGDLGVQSPAQTCSCGRQWEIMQSIQGRQTDVIVSPQGHQFNLHFFSLYLEQFPEIREYQIVQTAPGEITIRAVCQPASASLGTRVADRLRQEGLSDMAVHLEPVDTIPLTQGGKRRWVIGYKPTTSPQKESVNEAA
jgi:phenylacetate-CoA ligase